MRSCSPFRKYNVRFPRRSGWKAHSAAGGLCSCHRRPLSRRLTEQCGRRALLNTPACTCLLLNEPARVWWKGIFRAIQYLTGNQTESSCLIPALRSARWGPYSNFLHLPLIWQLSVSAPRLPPARTRRRLSGQLLILHRCQIQSLSCQPDGPCERHFLKLRFILHAHGIIDTEGRSRCWEFQASKFPHTSWKAPVSTVFSRSLR